MMVRLPDMNIVGMRVRHSYADGTWYVVAAGMDGPEWHLLLMNRKTGELIPAHISNVTVVL